MSKKAKHLTALLSLYLSLALPSIPFAQGHDQDHGHADAPKQASAQPGGDPYLLDVDPVSGAKLGQPKDLVVQSYDSRELRFASQETAKTFQSDPAKYIAAVDEKLVRQQLPLYPLQTCVVSGEKLGGDMGAAIDFIYRNRLVRFCCKDCKPKFLADPGKYLKQLDAAVVAAQAPKYPLKTCVVSGDEFGGQMGPPVDLVVGNRLLRLCCKDCKKEVAADPLKFLGKLGQPAQTGHDEHGEGHEHEHEHDHDKPHGSDKP